MTRGTHEPDAPNRALELLTAGATAEMRLLKDEQKAERRLAQALTTLRSDEAKLQKIQKRLDRSREAVAAAEANLRDFQTRRAAGPEWNHD